MMIHFYEGNPRNGGKAFGTGEVKHIHPIIIDPLENSIHVHNTITEEIKFIKNPDYLNAFARVDGFQDWEEMKTFFPKRFEGDFIDWGYSFKPIES